MIVRPDAESIALEEENNRREREVVIEEAGRVREHELTMARMREAAKNVRYQDEMATTRVVGLSKARTAWLLVLLKVVALLCATGLLMARREVPSSIEEILSS